MVRIVSSNGLDVQREERADGIHWDREEYPESQRCYSSRTQSYGDGEEEPLVEVVELETDDEDLITL